MINVTRSCPQALDRAAVSTANQDSDIPYSMTALLSLAVQRENAEHQLQARQATRLYLARWGAMAAIVSGSIAGLMTIAAPRHVGHLQRTARPTPTDVPAIHTAPVTDQHAKRSTQSAPIRAAVPVVRSIAQSYGSVNRVNEDHVDPVAALTLSSATFGTSVQKRDGNTASLDEHAVTSRLAASGDNLIRLNSPPQTLIDTKVVDADDHSLDARAQEQRRLTAIDAIRTLRSR